jgi:hypothetical protein
MFMICIYRSIRDIFFGTVPEVLNGTLNGKLIFKNLKGVRNGEKEKATETVRKG